MRKRRFLLVTAALSTAACGKDAAVKPEEPKVEGGGPSNPLPANPKGSTYDQPPPPPPPPPTVVVVPDAGKPLPLPANPKGSHYDAGKKPPPTF